MRLTVLSIMIGTVCLISLTIVQSLYVEFKINNSGIFAGDGQEYDYFDVAIVDIKKGQRFSEIYERVEEDYVAKENHELYQILITFKNNLDSPVKLTGAYDEGGKYEFTTFTNSLILEYLIKAYPVEEMIDATSTKSFIVNANQSITMQYVFEVPLNLDMQQVRFDINHSLIQFTTLLDGEHRICEPNYFTNGVEISEFEYECLKPE